MLTSPAVGAQLRARFGDGVIASDGSVDRSELARRVYGESDFGRLMDPLTDKVLVCAAFVAFVELQLVPAWLVVLIISPPWFFSHSLPRAPIPEAGLPANFRLALSCVLVGVGLVIQFATHLLGFTRKQRTA